MIVRPIGRGNQSSDGNCQPPEGYLAALKEASSQETPSLKRQTLISVLDFVVAPLDRANASIIAKAIARKDGLSTHSGLIHVQIADLSPEALGELRQKGVIRGFDPVA